MRKDLDKNVAQSNLSSGIFCPQIQDMKANGFVNKFVQLPQKVPCLNNS